MSKLYKCENTKLQITLQRTCKRDDTEEPGESGGNSGGPDVNDIFSCLNNSSKRINEFTI